MKSWKWPMRLCVGSRWKSRREVGRSRRSRRSREKSGEVGEVGEVGDRRSRGQATTFSSPVRWAIGPAILDVRRR